MAPDWRQARYDACETSTADATSPVVQAGLDVLSPRQISSRDLARKQAARERAEPVLRKPESNGTQLRTELAQLRCNLRN